MNYLWSLLLALGILALALALVLLQRHITALQRGVVVLLVFAGGVGTNYALSGGSSGTFSETLQQMLGWTYAALTMFAGAGSIEVVQSVVTPAGAPTGLVQVLHYFFQVIAFLFTISAVVAALARQWVDRVAISVRSSYDEVFEIHGTSEEALRIAKSLADPGPSSGRRLVAVIRDPSFTVEQHAELHRRIVVLDDAGPVRRKLAASRRSGVFLVDGGQPGFAETFHEEVARLSTLTAPTGSRGPVRAEPVLYVITSSAATRDLVASVGRTDFEVRCIELAELAARDLIHRGPPYRSVLAQRERAEPFRALVVADGGPLLERILEQLVMHGQFLVGRPRLMVLTEDVTATSFRVRHPEVDESAEIEIVDAVWGSTAAYGRLEQVVDQLDQVVVAFADEARGLEVARDILTYHRLHRPGLPLPRFLVRADSEDSPVDAMTFFGSRTGALRAGNVLDEAYDATARRVNAHYAGLLPGTEDYERASRSAWRGLTAMNRASSRASADFHDAMVTLWEHSEGRGEQERVDLLARTEHLRWNAFYRMMGYQQMSPETMTRRYAEAQIREVQESPEGRRRALATGPAAWGSYARDDDVHRQHVCLVPWERLPEVDAAYNALDERFDRDFQETDRAVTGLVHALGGRNGNLPEVVDR